MAHQLRVGRALRHKPLIAHVNWFRRGPDKRFLCPGYGANARVLQWLIKRAQGRAGAEETALGWIPRYQDMDWDGFPMPIAQWRTLMEVNSPELRERTLLNHEQLLVRLGDRAPRGMWVEKEALMLRLCDCDLPEAARIAAQGTPDDEVPVAAEPSSALARGVGIVCTAPACTAAGEVGVTDDHKEEHKAEVPPPSARPVPVEGAHGIGVHEVTEKSKKPIPVVCVDDVCVPKAGTGVGVKR